MPLCYGGGVKSLEQATRVVGLGVEKVAISSIAMENSEMITSMARELGSQSVVVVLDTRKDTVTGSYTVWTHNGTRNTGKLAIEAAKEAEQRGAGEVVINSIDNDGMMRGYDLDLASAIRSAVRLPLTILGGAGSFEDIRKLLACCGIVGAAAGSLFVFKGSQKAVLINYPSPQQRDDLIRTARCQGGAALN